MVLSGNAGIAKGPSFPVLLGLLHHHRARSRPVALLIAACLLATTMGLPASRAEAAGGATGYLAVAAGGHFACGIRADHTLACWGDNLYDETAVPSGAFTQLSAGEFHACALRSDGKAACWGYYGAAVIAPARGTFTHVAVGYDTDCGITTAGGTTFCWNMRKRSTVTGGEQLKAISTGIDATCGLDGAGSIHCRTSAGNALPAPAGAFTQISGSATHFCALRRDGTSACWGTSIEGPAKAAPPIAFSQISAGRAHACGLQSTGVAVCWGYGQSGETKAPRALYTQVTAGDDLSCGIRRDGSVDCWGSNVYGQLRAPHNLPNAAIYLENTYQSYKANLVRVGVGGPSSAQHETGLVIRADGRYAYVLTAGRLLRGVQPKNITIEAQPPAPRQPAEAVMLTSGSHTKALLAVIAFPSRAAYAAVPWGNSYRLVHDPTVFTFYLGGQGHLQPRYGAPAITAVGADRHDSLGSFWIEYAHAPRSAQPGDALITPDGSLLGITTAVLPNGTAIAVQSHWAASVVTAQIAALSRQLAS